MNGRLQGARRYRGLLILIATVLVALAAIPSAQSTQGQPVIAGFSNDSTTETRLNAAGANATGLVARGGPGGSGLVGLGDTTGVSGQSALGIGVSAVTFSAQPALKAENRNAGQGVAVEALTHAPNYTAIYGHHDAGSSGYGVYGEAPIGIGVQGRGSVYGVRGFSDSATGRGVFAENTAGGTALEAAGAVKFSTAGVATVPTGATQATVSAGVDVTTATKVLVTPMSAGGTFRFVQRDAAADKLTFRLSSAATSNLILAYFVIG
jgi:hypothetical protein